MSKEANEERTPRTVGDVKEMLTKHSNGEIQRTIQNCITILQNDHVLADAIRLNLLSERIDIVKPVGWPRSGKTLNDTDMKYILRRMEKYGISSEKKIESAIRIVANENRYHPIRDYLNGLKWDGTERIAHVLHHFLGAAEDEYTCEAMKIFLMGAIKRVFQPGCKFETMLCLVGGQGAGKSSFFRLLAVKDEFENAKYAGIACCMKNAGLGHGIPDWGRCRLVVEDGKVIVCVGASDMGQGASNVFCQNVGQILNLPADKIVYRASNSFECPDSGTSSGSRQTTVSGDACRVAALNLKAALEGHTLEDLNGKKTANTISSTYAQLAEQYGAEVTGVDDLNQTFELLNSGRIDATLNAEVTFYDYTKEHPDANVKIAVLTQDANEVAIPLRKGEESATLREAINAAIDELRASGQLKELSEKYFGTDISTNE